MSEAKNSGPAKPANLNSEFRLLQDKVENLTIFVDSWTEACKLGDDGARAEAMLALAEMWESLGAA